MLSNQTLWHVKMLVDKLCLCVNIWTYIRTYRGSSTTHRIIMVNWSSPKPWSSATAVILISLTNLFNISINGRYIILPSWDVVMPKQWKCNSTVKHTKALCVTAFAKRVLMHNSFSNVTWSTGICPTALKFEARPSYIALMWEKLVQYFLQMKWHASLKL